MKRHALLGLAAGAALAGVLLWRAGAAPTFALLSHVGVFGFAALVAFHLVQLLCSAAAWRAIAGPGASQPDFATFAGLRWIREGVNNLLPVAQIGGEVVGARLLQRRGVLLSRAVAGVIADLTLEMVTQIGFTLLGVALLLALVGDGALVRSALLGVVIAALLATGFLAVQGLGVARVLERSLVRLGRWLGWEGSLEVEGLHAALIGLYRSPRRVLWSALGHGASWLAGGAEICLALHLLGRDVGIGAGLVIESLGQAAKAVGFAVPGALGVQEGGYIAVAALFGLPADLAIALSLLKRFRELVLGVPSLAAWRWLASMPALPRPEAAL